MVTLFEMGIWLLFLAYVTSVVGSTLGLACVNQARTTAGPRLGWFALAALSIGGVGIWLAQFIGMLGFATPGQPVRYDVLQTVLSAVLAIAAVFAGLVVFGARERTLTPRLGVAGAIIGAGVAVMHFTGIWAINLKGDLRHNVFLVVLSVVIAVVLSTAALWLLVLADRASQRVLAGLVLGIGVLGMHYVAMAGVSVRLDGSAPDPPGVEVFSFLFPVFILAAVALAVPIVAVLTSGQKDTPTLYPAAAQ